MNHLNITKRGLARVLKSDHGQRLMVPMLYRRVGILGFILHHYECHGCGAPEPPAPKCPHCGAMVVDPESFEDFVEQTRGMV